MTNTYFKNKFATFSPYVIAAHRSYGQEYGRAKAGLAQLTRNDFEVKQTRVKTQNYRVQAQILRLSTNNILWINTYFPTDPMIIGDYDDSNLKKVLSEVGDLIKNSNYDDIVWASDINWDADRNTHFAKVVSAFIQRLGLIDLWSKFPVPYTHVHTDGKSMSIIDHILISPRLLNLVADCGIVERADNLSRHCPIWVKLRLGLLPLKPKVDQTFLPRRPCWSKADKSDRQNFSTCLFLTVC